jgi:hypothetical protein
MNKTLRTIGIASLFLGGLAATSPTYAASKSKPAMGMDMMKGGNMDEMMGMMSQMNKMMKLCIKMMEGKSGHHMKS